MARLDKIHNAVKNALIKDGWTITSENFRIEYEEITAYADIAAERTIAAVRGTEKIAVEVKSFLNQSLLSDFEKALGQYRLYRRLLSRTEPERTVYLAVSDVIYERFFTKDGIRFVVSEEEVSLIVVDIDTEELVQWIRP